MIKRIFETFERTGDTNSELYSWIILDDSIRSACAYTIQSIGIHNQDILKSYSETVLPLVFFAIHAEKTPETEKTLEVWNEIWSEQSPGTETGIRQNLHNICDILKTALESPSWTMKAQVSWRFTKSGLWLVIMKQHNLVPEQEKSLLIFSYLIKLYLPRLSS